MASSRSEQKVSAISSLAARRLVLLAALSLLPALGLAQNNRMAVVLAGTDWIFPAQQLPALNAPLGSVSKIVSDAAGNVYLADPSNDMVFRYSPADGTITVVAGNGTVSLFDFSGGNNGPADRAGLGGVLDIALDSNGSVIILSNSDVRRVGPDGNVRRISGQAYQFTSSTQAFANAIASGPGGLVYLGDRSTPTIWRLAPDGNIATVSLSACGSAVPRATLLASDASGNLYIGSKGLNEQAICKVAPDGGMSLLPLGKPIVLRSLAVASDGSLIIGGLGFADRISGGSFQLITGNPAKTGYEGDGGPASAALFGGNVDGVTGMPDGSIYLADTGNGRLRLVDAGGMIHTVAGNGGFSVPLDGTASTAASISYAYGLASTNDGIVYYADLDRNRVYQIDKNRNISTIAGGGNAPVGSQPLPARDAAINQPAAVAVDGVGSVYFIETRTNSILRVTPDGMLARIVGGGTADPQPGIKATDAKLSLPTLFSLAVDGARNVYFAQTTPGFFNQVAVNLPSRIYRAAPSGFLELVAGGGQQPVGDGVRGIDVDLTLGSNFNCVLAVDAGGRLYFSANTVDKHQAIWRIESDGTLKKVAGGGTGNIGDGRNSFDVNLPTVEAIAFTPAGELVFSFYGGLYKAAASGTLSRLAAGGAAGVAGLQGSGAKPADQIYLASVYGTGVDGAGNVYFSDFINKRIWMIPTGLPALQTDASSIAITGASAGPPVNGTLLVKADLPGVPITLTIADTPGSAAPAARWLQLNPSSDQTPRLISITADPSGLQPGTYSAIIHITSAYANPPQIDVAVRFDVGPALPPTLNVDKKSLSFSFARKSNPRSDVLSVSNSGGGSLSVAVTAVTNSGGIGWLAVSPSSVRLTAGQSVNLAVTANPTGLAPGTYTGVIALSSAGGSVSVPVVITIASSDVAELVTQTGLSFTAVAGGGVVPVQSFGIVNLGVGTMPWTISTETLGGGDSWILTDTTQGKSDANAEVPAVGVSVDRLALPAGIYYGHVRITAPDAPNSPQVVTVFARVLDANATPPAVVQPAEITVTTTLGENPSSQDVLIYNLARTPLLYTAFRNGTTTQGVLPFPDGGAIQPGAPTRVRLKLAIGNLGPGTYKYPAVIQFSDGNVVAVNVKIVVQTAAVSPKSGSMRARTAASACPPQKLIPTAISLGQSASVPAGWPAALVVDLSDDCGNPIMAGNLIASFSSGEPAIAMQSLNNGRWHGTWQTRGTAGKPVTITFSAVSADNQLAGTSQVVAGLLSSIDPPVTPVNGIVSAADPNPFTPIAPGAAIAINGTNLAAATTAAPDGVTLPPTLADVDVHISGREMPLYMVSKDVIKAFVPYDLPADVRHQIWVRRGNTYSTPVYVDVAQTQPAIFTIDGTRQAQLLSGAPAAPGDLITILCAGLGLTDPVLDSGTPTPADSSVRAVSAVQVQIGGSPVNQDFAGLLPGLVGVYQVRVRVPDNTPPGDVQVVIQAAGQSSPAATISVVAKTP